MTRFDANHTITPADIDRTEELATRCYEQEEPHSDYDLVELGRRAIEMVDEVRARETALVNLGRAARDQSGALHRIGALEIELETALVNVRRAHAVVDAAQAYETARDQQRTEDERERAYAALVSALGDHHRGRSPLLSREEHRALRWARSTQFAAMSKIAAEPMRSTHWPVILALMDRLLAP
jgi:hypothetical protein